MEIDMSYYGSYDTSSECGACVVNVENLDLTPGGLPGISFTGTLEIEPDHYVNNEDWYIDRATAEAADGRYVIYSSSKNIDIFQAICDTVSKNSAVRRMIDNVSVSHA
jgi:hypothetical protein